LLETVRECLQDVYDLPALDRLMRRLNTGEVQISGVTTTTPSPFAASLLFGYVAEFMYESDAPLAERRASVLSLDSELLGNLLGQADPGELLDPLVIRQIDDELQRLAPDRKARGKEGLFDLLRELGPMTPDDLAARHRESRDAVNLWLEELLAERRAFTVTIGESQRIACMDDAARLRDALGVRLPADLPDIWLNPVATPLADLFLRYVQTHTLFTVQQIAHAFGLGVAVAQEALEKLRDQGKVMRLRAGKPAQPATRSSSDWVGEEIFRRLRIRSLQAAREATRRSRRRLLPACCWSARGCLPGLMAARRFIATYPAACLKALTASCALSSNWPGWAYRQRCGKARFYPHACGTTPRRCWMSCFPRAK
jgi:ATP-dependent Lhr-like helicase